MEINENLRHSIHFLTTNNSPMSHFLPYVFDMILQKILPEGRRGAEFGCRTICCVMKFCCDWCS